MTTPIERLYTFQEMIELIVRSTGTSYDTHDTLKRIAHQLIEEEGYTPDQIRPIYRKWAITLPRPYICNVCHIYDDAPVSKCVYCYSGFHSDAFCAYKGQFCSRYCSDRSTVHTEEHSKIEPNPQERESTLSNNHA